MKGWNGELFRKLLKEIVEEGELNGESVSTREEIYELIANKLHYQKETVKGWARNGNKGGPGNKETLAALERLLGGIKLTKEEKKRLWEWIIM